MRTIAWTTPDLFARKHSETARALALREITDRSNVPAAAPYQIAERLHPSRKVGKGKQVTNVSLTRYIDSEPKTLVGHDLTSCDTRPAL